MRASIVTGPFVVFGMGALIKDETPLPEVNLQYQMLRLTFEPQHTLLHRQRWYLKLPNQSHRPSGGSCRKVVLDSSLNDVA